MNRFETNFIAKLASFCKENGYIITESGTIEPIGDWVDPNKPFHFVVNKEDGVVKIEGVEND